MSRIDRPHLIQQRLAAQQLARSDFDRAGPLVSWMCAVQAQDYNSVRWALGLRLRGAPSEAEVERAIAQGEVIRTHGFRGTWQLVAAPDVRWMLDLVSARVLQSMQGRLRQLALDAAVLRKGCDALASAIEAEGPLTRDALAKVLQRAGIGTTGQRLPHLLIYAELHGLICGGPRRGKQFTWQLLQTPPDRRSLEAKRAELARRFFQSRGPATVDDFCWWTGLRVSDARVALAAAGDALESEQLDEGEYWRAPLPSRKALARAHLLAGFDEWLVGYRLRDHVVDPKHKGPVNAGGGMIGMCVLLDGIVVGTWRRTLARNSVEVEVALFEKRSAAERAEIEAAVERYAAFLGLSPAATRLRMR